MRDACDRLAALDVRNGTPRPTDRPPARAWLGSRVAFTFLPGATRTTFDRAEWAWPVKPRDKTVYYSGPGGSGNRCPRCGWPVESCACAKAEENAGPIAHQRVRVSRSSAGRGGKTVTLIVGVEGGETVLAALSKTLKARCGAGGTVKDGTIEIQGDHVESVLTLLSGEGYRPKRSGG